VSELFDDDPQDAPPRRPSGRARWLVLTGVVLILLFFAVTTFASLFTDKLWYDAADYPSVFGTMFWTRTVLFVIFGLLMVAAIAAPVVVAYRARPFFHDADDNAGLDRYREAIAPIRTWLIVGIAGIAGIFAGVSGAGEWRTYLMWRHGRSFGRKDQFFGKDIGFYVFDLPWWHYVVNFALTALILGAIASIVVHYLYGGIRLSSRQDRFSRSAQRQISVLVALVLLVKGVDYWLDRYDLVHDSGPLVDGMSYTDEHAVLPAKNILLGVALICAVLFLLNVWRRSWQLPSIGLSLFVVCAILIGLIWPAAVQAFQVKPSEQDKERTYLAANIAATRAAYDIDDAHVKVQNYTSQADATKTSAAALDATASSLPIVDPAVVQQQFEQTQQGRSYYTVENPLDVDHYTIDGKDRALVLGVRELKQSGISPSDRTWTNLHTVYTHSNGVIAAYANMRGADDATEKADMTYAEGLNSTDLTGGQKLEDQVYFGEDSPDYSIVGRSAGGKAVELDFSPSKGQSTTTYAGKGGVSIGSRFRRLMYAIQFGSANFLLSERVNANSQILYNRTPQERVEKVAPWLTLDSDAYPVVVGGRLLWVVDGYTTTDRYPQSARDSFAAMTDDATQQNAGSRTLPTDEINYMRNAVKATVDAYDGTVNLYAWDDSDPILKTWEDVFPGTVKSKKEIPTELKEHLRYPEDLYKVQRYQLARYHVTDAVDFLNGNDRWAVPADPNNPGHLQAPYRMFLADDDSDRWSLTSTFVPYSRQNLAGIMSVDSDATSSDYGQIRILTGFGQGTAGPGLVSNHLRTDSDITDAIATFSRSASTPVWGQIITVPTTSYGLLYVEPVYATPTGQSTNESRYANLAFVLVSYNDRLGYGRTLQAALADALGADAKSNNSGSGSGTGKTGGSGPGTGGKGGSQGGAGDASVEAKASRLLSEAEHLYAEADKALQNRNTVRREKLLAQARTKVEQATKLLADH